MAPTLFTQHTAWSRVSQLSYGSISPSCICSTYTRTLTHTFHTIVRNSDFYYPAGRGCLLYATRVLCVYYRRTGCNPRKCLATPVTFHRGRAPATMGRLPQRWNGVLVGYGFWLERKEGPRDPFSPRARGTIKRDFSCVVILLCCGGGEENDTYRKETVQKKKRRILFTAKARRYIPFACRMRVNSFTAVKSAYTTVLSGVLKWGPGSEPPHLLTELLRCKSLIV